MTGSGHHSSQAGVLVLGRMLATLSDFAAPLILAHLLTEAELGILSAVVLLVYETLAMVVVTGFPKLVMYQLPTRPHAERRAVVVQMALTLLVMAIATAGLLLALAHWGRPLIDAVVDMLGGRSGAVMGTVPLTYFAILAVYPLGDLPARILPNVLVAENRARSSASFSLARALGKAAALIVPVTLGAGLPTVLTVLGGFGLLQGLWLVVTIGRLYGKAPRGPSPVSIRELVKFAVPLGATDVLQMLDNRLDRYLILLYFAVAELGIYQAGAFRIPLVTTITYSVNTAYLPRYVELYKAGKPEEAIALWRTLIHKVALVVVPIAMVFVVAAEETLSLLLPPEYLQAAWVFRWYSIFTLGRVAAFGGLLVAAGRPGLILQASVLSFLANVAISWPLVFWIGFEGPAVGTALAFIPTVIVYCWCIGRASNVGLSQTFPLLGYLQVVAVAAVPAGLAWGLKTNVALPAGIMWVLEAMVVLGGFAALGSARGLITRADWRFLADWIRLRGLRDQPPAP